MSHSDDVSTFTQTQLVSNCLSSPSTTLIGNWSCSTILPAEIYIQQCHSQEYILITYSPRSSDCPSRVLSLKGKNTAAFTPTSEICLIGGEEATTMEASQVRMSRLLSRCSMCQYSVLTLFCQFVPSPRFTRIRPPRNRF